MRTLSIRQPWAWLILHGGKDVENRDWSTAFRGRILVHAGKGMTRAEHEDAAWFAHQCTGLPTPKYEELERGGIVGSVEIVDCVTVCASPWFVGQYGFLLANPRPGPFVPWRGQLGFFDVPLSALPAEYREGA